VYVEGVNKAATGKAEGNLKMRVGEQSFAAQSDEHLVKAIGKERRADPGSLLRAAPRLLGDPDVSTRPTAGTTSRQLSVAPLNTVTLVAKLRNQASLPRWRRTRGLARGW